MVTSRRGSVLCNCLKRSSTVWPDFVLVVRIETGRHEGLPRNERSCHRRKRLLDEDFVAPIDDKEHLLFSCEIAKDIRLRFAGLPMSSLRDLMQCEDIGSVAWFVHECMERVDNSHTG
jgi:hypothetical protein